MDPIQANSSAVLPFEIAKLRSLVRGLTLDQRAQIESVFHQIPIASHLALIEKKMGQENNTSIFQIWKKLFNQEIDLNSLLAEIKCFRVFAYAILPQLFHKLPLELWDHVVCKLPTRAYSEIKDTVEKVKWFTPRGKNDQIPEKFRFFVNERSIPFRQLNLCPNDRRLLVPLLTQLNLYKTLPSSLSEALKGTHQLQRLTLSRRDAHALKEIAHPELLQSLKIIHDPTDVFCSFSVKELVRFKNLKRLECRIDLPSLGFTKKQLQGIGKLSCLEYLDLSGNPLEGLNPLVFLTSLTTLDLSNTGLKEEDGCLFHHFYNLKTLMINHNPQLAGNVGSLSSCKKLKNLSCYGILIEDNELGELRGLKLDSFKISDAPITGSVFNDWPQTLKCLELKKCSNFNRLDLINRFSELEELTIFESGKMDLRILSELTHLRSLNIASSRLTDQDLGYLGYFSQLRELNLSGNPITDQGLDALLFCPLIEKLNLNYTKITDAGLKKLKNFHYLTHLYLDGCKITGDGMQGWASQGTLEELHTTKPIRPEYKRHFYYLSQQNGQFHG